MLGSIKTIWTEWNIRGAVLLSLLLQVTLIVLSPFRRRTSTKWLVSPIWLAYLVADMVATFAIGLISKTHITNQEDPSSAESPDTDFLSFWTPFLLVHLGGPDTITAFALEDNQLWVRHLLSFSLQIFSTVYFFYLSFSNNKLKIPTLLMFIAGVIKYLERTCSLYLASKSKFRNDMIREPDPGLDYDKAAKYAQWRSESSQLPDQQQTLLDQPGTREGETLGDLELVKKGYGNFKTLKGLLADLILGFEIREFSRGFFFHKASAENALRVLEVELNFAYEVLYTKVSVVHSSLGRNARLVAISAVLLALSVFHFRGRKFKSSDIDVDVTYALLFGAIALDLLAFIMSSLSDWTVVASMQQQKSESWWKHHILNQFYDWVLAAHVKLLHKSDILYKKQKKQETGEQTDLARPILYRRWCRSVLGFNLLRYCISKPCKIGFGLQSFLDEWRFKSTKPLTLELWEFIFLELKSKSEFIDDAESVRKRCLARGEVVLERNGLNKGRVDLMPYIVDVTYDESLLLWHIATELLHNTKKLPEECGGRRNEELSKFLSDYMMYLLIMQPTMMATVSGTKSGG
ncbi:unnamed protein product [Linum tenue]|uniref:DUF4220 domain-containing protein n=1 Tax=Linum tenue TaxID=586396 RepID=A0AAV0L5D6_9ROSI|nr:unnamed protein product [Linum tenue]